MPIDDPARLPYIQELASAARDPPEGHPLDDDLPPDDDFVLESYIPDDRSGALEDPGYPPDDDFEEQKVE